MIQNYFALTGSLYLKTIFSGLIKELNSVEEDFEVSHVPSGLLRQQTNPIKIANKQDVEKNSKAMVHWATKFIESVATSAKLLPR